MQIIDTNEDSITDPAKHANVKDVEVGVPMINPSGSAALLLHVILQAGATENSPEGKVTVASVPDAEIPRLGIDVFMIEAVAAPLMSMVAYSV